MKTFSYMLMADMLFALIKKVHHVSLIPAKKPFLRDGTGDHQPPKTNQHDHHDCIIALKVSRLGIITEDASMEVSVAIERGGNHSCIT